MNKLNLAHVKMKESYASEIVDRVKDVFRRQSKYIAVCDRSSCSSLQLVSEMRRFLDSPFDRVDGFRKCRIAKQHSPDVFGVPFELPKIVLVVGYARINHRDNFIGQWVHGFTQRQR